MTKRNIQALFLITFLLALSQSFVISSVGSSETIENQPSIQAVEENLFPMNISAISQVISTISSFGSRMTGYPGYYDALDYIYTYLEGLRINSARHHYKVMVPYDEETYIEVLEPYRKKIDAYALYPNGINPSPTPQEGIIGKLVYIGKGELEDFDGKDIVGNIVAMDFNSGDNWIKAASLGAEAVIFIEPDNTNYHECDSKFLDTPICFPRVYVKKADWEELKNVKEIRLVTRVSWREIEAINLVGYINGTENPNDIVILSAHFDSWSVVPRLASSKTELVPLALLLEYARYLKENPPKYSVWIVIYSGHWQALTGAREFINDFFFRDEISRGEMSILANINLDLMASDSDGLQLIPSSMLTAYGGYNIHQNAHNRLIWFDSQIKNIVAEERVTEFSRKIWDKYPNVNVSSVTSYFNYQWFWGSEPVFYMLDSEPAFYAGAAAFSITTRRSARLYVGSPIDDSEYSDLEVLDPFLQVTLYIIDRLLRIDWVGFSKDTVKPSRLNPLGATLGYPGYTTFYGEVKTYNFSKGWHDIVPNALVEIQSRTSTYKLNKIIVKADEEGRFIVHGIPPVGAYVGIGGGTFQYLIWNAKGWILDDEGTILMATDLGQFGMRLFTQDIIARNPRENITVVVAKASSLEILDIQTPTTLTLPIIIDPRPGTQNNVFATLKSETWRASFTLYELSSNIPVSYGYYYNGREPAAVVWVQPGVRFVVLSPAGIILTNSSFKNTEGNGFYVEYGSKARINFALLQVAKDLYYLSYGRYQKLVEKNIRSPSADESLAATENYLVKIEELLNDKKYGEAYSYAMLARAYAYKTYRDEVMPLINDSAKSLLYLFIITIFGAFFLEKAVVHSSGSRRIITISIIVALFLILFSQLHPAFGLMANISLGMMGSLILILVLITLIVLMAVGEEIRKGIERRILGVHRTEISRFDTTMMSFSLGSEHMRRRPLRAVLVFLTMITMVIAMTSFTSLMPSRIVRPVPVYGVHSDFNQILIKQSYGAPPNILSNEVLKMVTVMAEDKFHVFPRVWTYAQVDNGLNPQVSFKVNSVLNSTNVLAILGLASEEIILKMSLFNLNVSGIYNLENLFEDPNSAIIPRNLATNLSVTIGDTIVVSGWKLKVVAIIEPVQNDSRVSYKINSMLESDGRNMLPTGPQYHSSISRAAAVTAPGAVPPNLEITDVIIVPFKKALDMGGYFASISIEPKEGTSYEDMENLASKLKYSLDVGMYLSYEGSPIQLSTFYSVVLGGWEIMWVIIIMGGMNIFATVLGSLKERTREVYIFSVIGLSPMGITVFFMTEVLVYAMASILLGYISGYFMTRLLALINIIPRESIFNFASTFTLLSTTVTIIAALAAAAYPSYIASKVATPSLERKWKFKTKPKGNRWDIPLLIGIPTLDEVKGLLAYLQEYYEGMGAVKEGVHMVKELYTPDYENLSLSLIVALSPFELGITQSVSMSALFNEKTNRYEITLHIERLSGPEKSWIISNYKFVDDFRKQLIVWGALTVSEKIKYSSRSRKTS